MPIDNGKLASSQDWFRDNTLNIYTILAQKTQRTWDKMTTLINPSQEGYYNRLDYSIMY